MSRLPRVAVVGAPNAGKSTLVNRLSGSRVAVVHETPGVTRDRKEVEVEWGGRRFVLVDTGGYDTTPDAPFAAHVREQVRRAVEEADAVVFVVDGRVGPLADDHEIAAVLRRRGEGVLLVANKMDDPAAAPAPEVYRLGLGEPLAVSALHGTGSGELLDRLLELLGEPAAAAAAGEAGGEVPVAIVGRPNAGKSSLFNAVVGEPRTIVSDVPGTTRDAIDTRVETAHGRFLLIDTAGLRRHAGRSDPVEYYATLRSRQSLDRAHVAVVVCDATVGVGDLDLSICGEAMRRHCATVVAVNKVDLVRPDLEDLGELLRRKLRQKPPLVAVSALRGEGVGVLLDVVADLGRRYTARIATAELNRAVAAVAAERPGPLKKGRRLKMYYATQYATAPPRLAIEVNDRALVTRDYAYYVENRLRARFGLDGVPLVIDFKGKR